VCYFQAEREAKLTEDYKRLAKHLEVEEKEESDRISMVNNKLIELAKIHEIIFIFDNVEDYSLVEKYIRSRPESISVLTTVRNKDTIQDDTVLPIELEPFSIDEATVYLVQVLGENKVGREKTVELVEIVGESTEVIPFNLNKVVSILSEPILGVFKKKRMEVFKKNPKLWLQTQFYKRLVKNETTAKILEFIPYFDPDSIDIELLALVIGSDGVDSLEDSLGELINNFVVKQNENGDQISVHRLTQKDLIEYFKSSENKENNRKRFIKIIDEKFSGAKDKSDIWSDKHNAHMHAISLVDKKIITADLENDVQINEMKMRIFSKLARYFREVQSKNDLALRNGKNALEIRERLYHGDHPDKASSYNNIGTVYREMGDLKNSLEYHRKALDIQERLYPSDHKSKAKSYNNVGCVYRAMGDLTSSFEYHRKALDMRGRLYPDDHQDKAASCNNIGFVYRAMGDLTNSLEYHRKALDIQERLYPSDHPGKASSYNNIGTVYREMGDLKNSLEYHRKALDMRERLYPDDHPDKASSYNNIGLVQHQLEDLTNSLEYHRKALDMRARLYPDDHQDKAASCNNIGFVYRAMGDLTNSLEYYRKALNMRARLYPDDHPGKAKSYNNIGSVYRAMGDLTKALEYHRKALDMRERLYPDDHPDKASSYNNIGSVYRAIGDLTNSLEYRRKALDFNLKIFPGFHLA
jgi:tetratricopeptide (TPR) repeat protein